MEHQFSREELIFGADGLERLKKARVIIFGVGGVGGFAAETLARSGVGAIDLVDSDTVSLTNLNRQIIALHSTLGRAKVDVMAERIRDINPDCAVETHRVFYTDENAAAFDFSAYDYAVDCIDTVAGKIQIVLEAQKAGIGVISAMGAGNKTHPELFAVADISKTSVCPLARVMRRELKARGVKKLKVVFSTEPPRKIALADDQRIGKRIPGSTAFTPAAAGILLASEVVRDLLEKIDC